MAESRAEFPLEKQLRSDIQVAQRAHDQTKVDTLRMVLGAIHNLEVARTDSKNEDHGKPLTEQDCTRVLEREVKMREQAIPFYKKAGREDLVTKEEREKELLQSYLQSSQISDDEIRVVVQRLIAEQGTEFKKVMPLAARELKGRAAGGRVQNIVKELIQ